MGGGAVDRAAEEQTTHSQLGGDRASLCYKILRLRPLVLPRVARKTRRHNGKKVVV